MFIQFLLKFKFCFSIVSVFLRFTDPIVIAPNIPPIFFFVSNCSFVRTGWIYLKLIIFVTASTGGKLEIGGGLLMGFFTFETEGTDWVEDSEGTGGPWITGGAFGTLGALGTPGADGTFDLLGTHTLTPGGSFGFDTAFF